MPDPIKRPLREDEQLYFIHVPKCAGTSFISLVDERYVIDEIVSTHYDINKLKNEITDEQLAGYRFIRGHFPYDLVVPRLPRQPRIITFLREPVTRLISNFQMRQRVSDPLVGMQETLKNTTLDEFVEQPELIKIFSNRATRLIGGMTKGNAGALVPNLELAKERISNFDFVGIVERFNDSLEMFCYIFGFPPIVSERNLNISPNRETRSEITPWIMQRLAEIEWADIELYRFGAQLFEKQFARWKGESSAGEIPATLPNENPGPVFVDFRRVDPGNGWHVGERIPRYGVVRWSGPETMSHIRLHLAPGRDYAMRFRILRSVSRDILNSLVVEAGGRAIPLKKRPADIWGGVIVDAVLPRDAVVATGPTLVTFKVNKTLEVNQISDNIALVRKFFRKKKTGGRYPQVRLIV